MIDLFGRRKLAREIARLKAEAVASADENCANRLRAATAEKELAALKAKTVPTVYCSFCGKSQHEVRKLIAGPTALICDECVGLCVTIVDETDKAKADLDLIDEAIEAHFGERCQDADPECMACRAWAYIDKVSGRSAKQYEARAAK